MSTNLNDVIDFLYPSDEDLKLIYTEDELKIYKEIWDLHDSGKLSRDETLNKLKSFWSGIDARHELPD